METWTNGADPRANRFMCADTSHRPCMNRATRMMQVGLHGQIPLCDKHYAVYTNAPVKVEEVKE